MANIDYMIIELVSLVMTYRALTSKYILKLQC